MAGRIRGTCGAAALLAVLLAVSAPVLAAHKPIYKWSVDELGAGEWEAHFVWLQSPYFNYAGNVYWEFEVVGPGTVDVLFLEWKEFEAFRTGEAFQALVGPVRSALAGAQGLEGLTPDLPYVLVFANPSPDPVRVEWTIYADVDWRRWGQGQGPGPALHLVPVAGSPLLALGETWEMAFREPGVYRYYCDPHTDMTGLIEVVPSDVPGPPMEVDIHHFGFHDEILEIAQGTTVRWTNHDGVGHSVQVDRLVDGIPSLGDPAHPVAFLLAWWPVLLVPAAAVAALLVRRHLRGQR